MMKCPDCGEFFEEDNTLEKLCGYEWHCPYCDAQKIYYSEEE